MARFARFRRIGILAASLLLVACGESSRADPSLTRAAADTNAEAARGVRSGTAPREIDPFADRVTRPDSVRALYVNGWAAGSRSRMRNLIAIADSTEINAFVIDIKESDTYLTHDSTGIELAREIGADGRPASKWLPALVDTLQRHGIYPIARIVVFKDRMLAEKRPDLAIRHTGGGLWKDEKGKPWVNPYDRTVWDYNIAIAKEALDMGFAEIQWDYVRFPDVREQLQRTMSFPGADGMSKAENIHDFILYSKQQLAKYRVPVTADVFGLSTHLEGDVGIGQQWEKVITAADAVLPMVYPSHYYTGMYGFRDPNAKPYEVVRIAMQDAVERTAYERNEGKKVGEVIPWLQAFSAPWVDDITYAAPQLRAQIQATYDSGLKSWVVWNPGSKYEPYLAALRPKGGGPSRLERGGWQAPQWTPARARLSKVIVKREAAERAARAAADSAAQARAAEPAPPAGTGGV